jgi:hypothetical protein
MNLYIRIDEKASQSFKSICASKHINMSGYIAKRIEESVRTGFIPVDIEKSYKKLNTTISVSIKKEKYEYFKNLCDLYGHTYSSVLRQFIYKFIKTNKSVVSNSRNESKNSRLVLDSSLVKPLSEKLEQDGLTINDIIREYLVYNVLE